MKKLLASLLTLSVLNAQAATLATATIGTTPSASVPASFLGFSIEWCNTQTVLGQASTGGADPIFRQLTSNLTAYGSGPLWIRVGGGSTDSGGSCSTPTGIQSVQAMNEFATATGTKFTFGVNLVTDNLTASQAQAAAYCAGMPAGAIAGFEIGNEPEFYTTSGWNQNVYYTELAQWLAGIQAAQSCTSNMVAPSFGTYNGQANGTFVANIPGIYVTSQGKGLTIATGHYYTGNGQVSGYLLTSAANNGPGRILPKMQAAHALGMQFRVDEMNSLTGGGTAGVSNAFESALWFIAQAMNYAAEGIDGINVHGGYLASALYTYYTPFAITTTGGVAPFSLASGVGGPAVGPLYYGMLFFQKALNGANATIYPVTLALTPSSANVQAWSTVDSGGVQRLLVVNRDTTNSGNVVIANGATTASACYLTAPSFSSTSGLQIFSNFAGTTSQSFDASTTGAPTGSIGWDVITPSAGSFTVPMGTAQAMILTFGSSTGC